MKGRLESFKKTFSKELKDGFKQLQDEVKKQQPK